MIGWPPKKTYCTKCGKEAIAPDVYGRCGVCQWIAGYCWRFGTIVTMDYLPDIRIMVVRPTSSDRSTWEGMVLHDDGFLLDPLEGVTRVSWAVGEMITLSPANAGIRIVNLPEEGE